MPIFRVENKSFRWLLAELVIVVVGVLIALWVDQWISDQNERELERQYVSRLTTDLNEDINRFTDFINGLLNEKQVFLQELEKLDGVPSNIDRSIFNSSNIRASGVRTLPESQSSTFREMESSGNIRLLADTRIRVAVEDYYDNFELMWGILEEPIGNYRRIIAESIPGSPYLEARLNGIEMSDSDIRRGLEIFLSNSEYKAAVNSELHYTTQINFYLELIIERAQELLNILTDGYNLDEG